MTTADNSHKHHVYIALGTNLGDRKANLSRARDRLAPEVRILDESPVYETPPWGYHDQPNFFNQVIQGATDLTPRELLYYLKGLEKQLGRQKAEFNNAPRVIDLDILFYDDLILETPDLTIPHPRMRGRAFVLVPLAELAPDFNHPALGYTVDELLQETDTQGIQKVPNS